MVELHQYPAAWGLPSLSPFCIKVEAFLRMAKIPYHVVTEKNPARGPKGKMPFVKDGSACVADSTFIIQHLIRTRALNEFVASDPREVAHALALQRLVEEHLYFVLLYSRWVDPCGWDVLRRDFQTLFPPLVGAPFLRFIRSQLRRQASGQGIARHSLDEVYEIGSRDIEAIAAHLGDRLYFGGNRQTTLDATVFAFLITILKQPIQSKLKESLLSCSNLVLYCERLEQLLFPEWASSVSASASQPKPSCFHNSTIEIV